MKSLKFFVLCRSYLEFHKSRTCSFAATRMNQVKLLDWLKATAGDCVNKLRKDTVDILVYLAKEVVAELIDLALLVRQDVTAVPGDPLSRAVDPLPTNPRDTYGHKQSQVIFKSIFHKCEPDELSNILCLRALQNSWLIMIL